MTSQHREQQPRIGVGADRYVLERAGRLGPARIDDDDPAAALDDRVQRVLDPRCGEDAAVGDEWVGADDQQEVGAREVRDRDDDR